MPPTLAELLRDRALSAWLAASLKAQKNKEVYRPAIQNVLKFDWSPWSSGDVQYIWYGDFPNGTNPIALPVFFQNLRRICRQYKINTFGALRLVPWHSIKLVQNSRGLHIERRPKIRDSSYFLTDFLDAKCPDYKSLLPRCAVMSSTAHSDLSLFGLVPLTDIVMLEARYILKDLSAEVSLRQRIREKLLSVERMPS